MSGAGKDGKDGDKRFGDMRRRASSAAKVVGGAISAAATRFGAWAGPKLSALGAKAQEYAKKYAKATPAQRKEMEEDLTKRANDFLTEAAGPNASPETRESIRVFSQNYTRESINPSQRGVDMNAQLEAEARKLAQEQEDVAEKLKRAEREESDDEPRPAPPPPPRMYTPEEMAALNRASQQQKQKERPLPETPPQKAAREAAEKKAATEGRKPPLVPTTRPQKKTSVVKQEVKPEALGGSSTAQRTSAQHSSVVRGGDTRPASTTMSAEDKKIEILWKSMEPSMTARGVTKADFIKTQKQKAAISSGGMAGLKHASQKRSSSAVKTPAAAGKPINPMQAALDQQKSKGLKSAADRKLETKAPVGKTQGEAEKSLEEILREKLGEKFKNVNTHDSVDSRTSWRDSTPGNKT